MGNITEFPDFGPELTQRIIKGALEVHRALGPGLLESAYESCLLHELVNDGLAVERQKALPLVYKDIKIDEGFRIDLWVERKVVLELKAVEKTLPIHQAQLLTYMRLSQSPLGLIINFNEKLLRDGIKRLALTPSQ